MAIVSNEAIKKIMKRVYAILKVKTINTKGVNPDQYLRPFRYPEGPTKWYQKSFWESDSYHRR
ncbi:MAG: hypothetical protein ACFFCW_13270 [Candidatus Hodarchaeota archaeon]